MKKECLTIFTDCGLDDAAALSLIFNERERFGTIVIVAVGGNVSPSISLRNVKTLLSLYDKDKLEDVILVNTEHISQPEGSYAEIHGKDGMGDIFVQSNSSDMRDLSYSSWLDGLERLEVILCLSPCTLLQEIVREKEYSHLLLMGGHLFGEECYGGFEFHNGHEFNQGMDVDAFSFCSQRAQGVITLDTCHVPAFNLAGKEVNETGVLQKILERYQELELSRHPNMCYVYDLIAAQALLCPHFFVKNEATDYDGTRISLLRYVGEDGNGHE